MKISTIGVTLLLLSLVPSVSYAKGVPLFLQTGDELFEIEGGPQYQDGYSLGYACQRFGLFGADIWTWDCKLMAVNLDKFSAGDIDAKDMTEFSAKFSESDRKRNVWNHYGILILLAGAIGLGIFRKRTG